MDLIIKTKYSSIKYNEINFNKLSKNAKEFFELLKDTADIFFKDEIDLHEFDKDNDFLDEIIEIVLAKKFKYPDQVIALAKFKNVDYNDIKEKYDTRYKIKSTLEEFIICNENEVDEKVFELALDFIKNQDDEYFEYTSVEEYKDFVNKEWFNKAMHDYHMKYVKKLKNEEPIFNDYINKLHEEMVKKNIMKKPNWSKNSYKNKLYKQKLEKEIDKKIDQFVEMLNNEYKDGIDFWIKKHGVKNFGFTAWIEDQVDYINLTKDFIKKSGRVEAVGAKKEEIITIYFDGKKKTYHIFEL